MTTKICFKCHKEKPLSDFYKHPQTSDGRLGKCIECTKSDVRLNREINSSYYVEYEKKRFKTARRKVSIAKTTKKQRILYPEKYKARSAVSNAIRDGRLTRKPCRICGSKKSQAHHHDYKKPLDVDWLCFKHHREIAHNQKVHST